VASNLYKGGQAGVANRLSERPTQPPLPRLRAECGRAGPSEESAPASFARRAAVCGVPAGLRGVTSRYAHTRQSTLPCSHSSGKRTLVLEAGSGVLPVLCARAGASSVHGKRALTLSSFQTDRRWLSPRTEPDTRSHGHTGPLGERGGRSCQRQPNWRPVEDAVSCPASRASRYRSVMPACKFSLKLSTDRHVRPHAPRYAHWRGTARSCRSRAG